MKHHRLRPLLRLIQAKSRLDAAFVACRVSLATIEARVNDGMRRDLLYSSGGAAIVGVSVGSFAAQVEAGVVRPTHSSDDARSPIHDGLAVASSRAAIREERDARTPRRSPLRRPLTLLA